MRGVCKSLMAEHDVILQVLAAIEKEVAGILGGGAVNRTFFEDAIAFVREFADGVHHHKEEVILFPRLIRAGIPEDGGPVGCMLKEHDSGRAHIAALSDALGPACEGDTVARQRVVDEATGYVNLLKAHIDKENHVLFPMADQVFDSDAKVQVLAAFEEAEANDASVTSRRREWAETLK